MQYRFFAVMLFAAISVVGILPAQPAHALSMKQLVGTWSCKIKPLGGVSGVAVFRFRSTGTFSTDMTVRTQDGPLEIHGSGRWRVGGPTSFRLRFDALVPDYFGRPVYEAMSPSDQRNLNRQMARLVKIIKRRTHLAKMRNIRRNSFSMVGRYRQITPCRRNR
ncbi:MAG: hypothetical protein AAGJ94_04895 [Pseudomonadota bacterium]